MKLDISGMEKRWTASEVASIFATNDDNDAKIFGYAAVFYDGSSRTEYSFSGKIRRNKNAPPETFKVFERIMPGAFDGAVGTFDTACLFNHDRNILLGRYHAGTLKLNVDDRGLRFEALPMQISETLRVIAHIQRGEIRGCSFGFGEVTDELVEATRDGETVYVRNITKIGKLYDVGPVTFPAYDDTDCFVRDLTVTKEVTESFRTTKEVIEEKLSEIRTMHINLLLQREQGVLE